MPECYEACKNLLSSSPESRTNWEIRYKQQSNVCQNLSWSSGLQKVAFDLCFFSPELNIPVPVVLGNAGHLQLLLRGRCCLAKLSAWQESRKNVMTLYSDRMVAMLTVVSTA